MATISTPTSPQAKQKRHSLRIDMTPMVDLGFLLITFFIFTATLSQPTVTKLIMPKDGDPLPVPESKTLTFLLSRNQVYAYEGRWETALAENKLVETSYHLQEGMGQLIRKKQAALKDKSDLVVVIKPLAESSYQNMLAALDEMQINVVNKYAIVNDAAEEVRVVSGVK